MRLKMFDPDSEKAKPARRKIAHASRLDFIADLRVDLRPAIFGEELSEEGSCSAARETESRNQRCRKGEGAHQNLRHSPAFRRSSRQER
jgi:hypothetical protein